MPTMTETDPATFTDASFTIGSCDTCEREVLTFPALDTDGDGRCCVHCDAPVTRELRLASGADLPDHGYGLLELQGCGNPECGGGTCSRQSEEEPPPA